MSIIEHIIRAAQIASVHHGIALSTYGRREFGHGHFFNRLSAGRVTIRRAEAAMQHLSEHWPADLEWPCDIPRPTAGGGSSSHIKATRRLPLQPGGTMAAAPKQRTTA